MLMQMVCRQNYAFWPHPPTMILEVEQRYNCIKWKKVMKSGFPRRETGRETRNSFHVFQVLCSAFSFSLMGSDVIDLEKEIAQIC